MASRQPTSEYRCLVCGYGISLKGEVPQLELLYAGLVRLATPDGTVLAALVERMLAGDALASSSS